MYFSQIGQDRWVHSVLGNKTNGFFIELGASNGEYISNTLFFEKSLGWNGICIEPNPRFHTELAANRHCHISHACVSSEDDQLIEFAVCEHASGATSTPGPFANNNEVIKVGTKTMKSILTQFNAPSVIDYLSLDVEGHEYEVLKYFPFSDYTINCITVEHNEPHTGPKMRNDIRALLQANGYIFIKGNDDVERWGHGPIDDFYIHSSVKV